MTPLSAKVLAHIRAKWRGGCPVCGSKKFTEPMRVDLVVGDAAILSTWGGHVPGVWVPCAAFSCRNCGYVMMLNAHLAGLDDVLDTGDEYG